MPHNMIIEDVLFGVSAVIFDRDERVLMFHRTNDTYVSGWEFVKGGLHTGESHLMAAVREIREEAGPIKVEYILELPKTYLVDVKYRKKEYSWVNKKTLVFLYLSGTPKVDNREHSEYQWMNLSKACEVCWVEHGEEILKDSSAAFKIWLSSNT